MTDTYPLNSLQETGKPYHPIHVTMPDGNNIASTHQGILPWVAPLNMKAHVLPALSHSLISVGKLCDAGCKATFDAKQVTITHNDHTILQGQRNKQGLWTIPSRITEQPHHEANFTIHDAISKDIIKFLHLSLFSPTKTTLLKAIKNNHFIGWPGLTEHNVKRYLTLQEPTIMGHMDQQRQNARSTKIRTHPTQQRQPMTSIPIAQSTNFSMEMERDMDEVDQMQANEDGRDKTYCAYLSLQDLPTGRVYTDQTGPFPVVSTQGIKATMILYDYDSNAILVEGITSRGKTELLRAYTTLLQRLVNAGLRLSSYAQLHGNYNFNSSPMAPPGCEIIAFVQPPAQRQSWGYHGIKAWYVQPAMNHYRCIKAIAGETGREMTVETVEYLPHNFRMPRLSSQDLATIAAHDLAQALRRPNHFAAPFIPIPVAQTQAFRDLSSIYTQMTTLPPPRVLHAATNNTTVATTKHLNQPLPRVPTATGNITTQDVTLPTPSFPGMPLMHQCNSVFDPDTGKSLEYRQLIKHPTLKHIWLHSSANEFGRLAQGIRDIPGTNTIAFIPKKLVPYYKRVTYGRFVTDIRPQKEEQHRTRLTIGGNLIDYPGDVSAPTGGLVTYKLHCNDIVSTPGARCMNMDIHNYYLNTPLPDPEYMKIHISLIPEEIIEAYDLWKIVDEQGYIFIQINKGMYGLPQAGILAYQLLVSRLALHGYYPVRHTPGYWRHISKPTAFVLVVDDFSVKFTDKRDAEDLLAVLRQWYEIKADWEATLYCGITTTWDYPARKVTLSMPGYVNTMLTELNHPHPRRPQHSPHPHVPVLYGPTPQLTELPDDTAPLSPEDNYQPAKIIGKLLYYARAVDSTLNVALSSLAAEQNKPTLRTKRKIIQLLDYCATHADAQVTFRASNMQLHLLHSDAGYNSKPGAKSRAGGHLFLGNAGNETNQPNGAILNPTHIIKHVATSAADAEIGAAFINCKEAIPIRVTLTEMGYLQTPTLVTLDNTTAVGFINKQMKQRRTKAIDMRYYWLHDQEAQHNFRFEWDKGANNQADYFTKHHPPAHHQLVRPSELRQHGPHDERPGGGDAKRQRRQYTRRN